MPCKFFAQGICAKGESCRFSHDSPAFAVASGVNRDFKVGGNRYFTPCKFFQLGVCSKGAACTFSHDSGIPGLLGKGKGKGKAPGNLGQGHLLPRTRVTEEPLTGVVLEWRGKYGWIAPDDELGHEKAGKH